MRNWFDRFNPRSDLTKALDAISDDLDKEAEAAKPIECSIDQIADHRQRGHLRLVGAMEDFPKPPPKITKREVPDTPAVTLLRSMLAEKSPVFEVEAAPGEYRQSVSQLRWAARRLGVTIEIRPHPINPDHFYLKPIQKERP